MKTAAVRIGRVRMKAGGADVRVLRSSVADTECTRRMRSWLSRALSGGARPDAFVALSFTLGDDYHGGVATVTAWHSEHHALQTDLLPMLTERVLTRQITAAATEASIMRELGYVYEDEPDPVA